MVRCWGTMQQSLSGPEDCWASDLDMNAIAVGMLRECKCLSSIVAIYFCALGNLVHTHYRAHTGRRFIAPKLQVRASNSGIRRQCSPTSPRARWPSLSDLMPASRSKRQQAWGLC